MPRLNAPLLLLVLAALSGVAEGAGGLRISNRYSPLNRQRPVRARTDYIILHTTEGQDGPSLARIRRGGLAHYVVQRDGRVRRVIARQRIARHAGRSVWNGKMNLDHVSLGIEVVGYHNRDITDGQITALRELLRQLQSVYKIPDDHVLTHSMVAYGKGNRWHRNDHRGRKRCGMQFARPSLRRRLGLSDRPLEDPDVAAGRLAIGDPYLATVLYGPDSEAEQVAESRFEGPDANVITGERTAWFIARDEYAAATTVYVFPGGRKKRGDEIKDWSRIPRGTRVLVDQAEPKVATAEKPAWRVLGRDGITAGAVAGRHYRRPTTLYVRPNGRVSRGNELSERDFRRLPKGTRVFVGFRYAGKVTRGKTAYELCGPRYRRDTTLYLMPGGKVRTGRQIREKGIPGGTLVLVAA